MVPVLQPRLPSALAIHTRLSSIDARRWYSNYGPLVLELERRLSQHYGAGVVTVSSCTSGITAALLAMLGTDMPRGAQCIVPSWTFAATPHAIRAAGLQPFFHDVDRRTWALDPDAVAHTLQQVPARAVLVVSPFGAPLDIPSWEAFQANTGCRVIIDAAAAFDSIKPSSLPAIVSMHATKILGAGEGGFILSTHESFLQRARACANFGFSGTRVATTPALNAKMSEYHAAVALASLDAWLQTRTRHQRITNWYRSAVAAANGFELQSGFGNGWVSSTTNILLRPGIASQVAQFLLARNIESRAWWGEGCHIQPAFADCPRGNLHVTDQLGKSVLGLPHFPDIRKEDVLRIVNAVSTAVAELAPARRSA